MSYGIRKQFYTSKVWKNTKNNIWLKQNCLCAICKLPVYVDGISDYIPKENRRTGIVHHIIELDDINVYDNNIALGEDNLIGVCKYCHEHYCHNKDNAKRKEYCFDEEGNLIPSPPVSDLKH